MTTPLTNTAKCREEWSRFFKMIFMFKKGRALCGCLSFFIHRHHCRSGFRWFRLDRTRWKINRASLIIKVYSAGTRLKVLAASITKGCISNIRFSQPHFLKSYARLVCVEKLFCNLGSGQWAIIKDISHFFFWQTLVSFRMLQYCYISFVTVQTPA